MSAVPEIRETRGWQANISIHFARKEHKTVMASLRHSGPLRVQRAFYPEGDVCHVYLLHPPAGIVGGDSLNTTISTTQNSHALLTTPGSAKFYRSAGDYACVTQTLNVAKDSVLEWFPQENILFPGAKVKIKTQINLESGAGFTGWEINCLGRPANEEVFSYGELDACLKIQRDGKPLLIERQRINDPRQLNASAGLRGYPMNAIFVASPCQAQHVDIARAVVADVAADFPVGITLIDNVLVLRALGNRTEKLQAVMIPVWQALRPYISHKVAVLPRIWST